MYKRNKGSAEQWRRLRKKKSWPSRTKPILVGAVASFLLLVGAGQAIGGAPDAMPTNAPEDLTQKTWQSQENEVQASEKGTGQNGAQPSPPAQPAKHSDEDWKLLLVNPWNPLPDGYSVTLTQLKNGHSVDERCYPELQAMMDDCRTAGLSPLICSSYRTQKKQESLFQNQVNKLIAQGFSQDEARNEAGKSIAVPGTSEHQLGLAVDIVDVNNQNLDESQETTPVQRWLMENSWKYGFIFRYPAYKTDLTGVAGEVWHYRYVGKEAAQEIHEQGVCLEEYLENLPEDGVSWAESD